MKFAHNDESGKSNVKVAISVVLYRTEPLLFAECARSIIRSSYPAETLVIDNSPDRGLENLVNHFGFRYLHLSNNPGYGRAHNKALISSFNNNVVYHLVLNPDVQFPVDAIEKLVVFMEANQNVAHLMPKVVGLDGTVQRLCKLVPTPFDLFLRRFIPRSLAQEHRKRFELWDCGYDKVSFVPYLSGCFMFLRISALKEVGIFDERFFMYPEDIDLTRRLAVRFDTVFFPDVSVTHLHGAASYKSLRMLFIHIYNMVKYFNKWGWFFDRDRRSLNLKTLTLISKKAQK